MRDRAGDGAGERPRRYRVRLRARGSGEIGVAAGSHVCQKGLQILVRVPDVEGEGLQVVEGLDRLQALLTGELFEGGTTRRGLRLIDSLRFGHVTSSASGLQVCQVHAT